MIDECRIYDYYFCMRDLYGGVRFISLYRWLKKFYSNSLLSDDKSIADVVAKILNDEKSIADDSKLWKAESSISEILNFSKLKRIITLFLRKPKQEDVPAWVKRKYDLQVNLNEIYTWFFGAKFYTAFESTFWVSLHWALHKCKFYTAFMQMPLIISLSSLDFLELKNKSIVWFSFTGSYSPWWKENWFEFGFLKGVKSEEVVKIPFINFENAKVKDFLESGKWKRIFSSLRRVFALWNHDNTLHNFFFLNKEPKLNSSSSQQIFNDYNYPFELRKIWNIYEIWSIHAHRDLIYKLYELIPDFKNSILQLWVELMEELKKVSDMEVRKILLESFAYFYWRIIDIFWKEFYEPSVYNDFETESQCYHANLHILKENIKTLSKYREYKALWDRIHNEKNPKLINPYVKWPFDKYYSHQDVIKTFDPESLYD